MQYKDDLVKALAKEIVAEKEYLAGETVQTIYFGGGTPSLLPPGDCAWLIEAIHRHFPVATDAEITLEANPDDIGSERLQAWKDMGINRLSIGVQSFFEEELRWMNRAHNSRQAREGLELALGAFDNITLDLIYGSPLLTDDMWRSNIATAVNLGVPHLSCYALTVEEKTPLFKSIRQQRAADVEPDRQARQFLLLMEELKIRGYEHYEVSNFARPGFKSRHNASYWSGAKYLGIGPSAHSYNGQERRWNLPNNQAYISGMEEGRAPRGQELLTPVQRLNEYIMIALRTSGGMDLDRIGREWGPAEKQAAERSLGRFIRSGHVVMNGQVATLTNEGMLLADGIASDLFS